MAFLHHLLPRKVGTKLLAVVLVAVGLSLALAIQATWMVYRDAQAASRELAVRATETLALQVAAQMGEHDMLDPLPPFAHYNIQRTIDYAHRMRGNDAEIFDLTLKIIADTHHADIGRHEPPAMHALFNGMLQDGQPRFFTEPTADSGHLQAAVPLRNQAGELVGGAVLEYSSQANALASAAQRSIAALMAAGMTGLIIIVYISLTTVRPIARAVQRLHGGTRALAEGKPLLPVGVTGNDELSELSRAFDEMSQQLVASRSAMEAEVLERRSAQAALEAANQHLEQRVAERTASLASANHQLEDELAHGKEMERQLEQLARFDALTHLPNRAMFLNCLEQAIKRAHRNGGMMALTVY